MNDHSERWYLDRFKLLYPAFPEGTIVKTESPDFVIETVRGTIGIELTELSDAKQGEHSAARLLAFRRMMVQHVIAQLRTRLPWQFAIDIDLAEPLEIPKNKRVEWVKEVAGFCLDEFSDLSPGESRRVEHVDFDIFSEQYAPVQQEILRDGYRNLPAGVQSILLLHSGVDTWDLNGEGGSVPDLTLDILSPVLERKHRKLPSYQLCTQHWLVIVEGSEFYNYYDQLAFEQPVVSVFDKVFLLRNINEEVVAIK